MTLLQEKVIYLNFYDMINDVKVKAIMAALSDMINREKPDTIYFLISCPGGNVDPGITLYNFIRALPVEIIMHNTGNIDSIALMVFLAADTRYTSLHSSFLLHGIYWPFKADTVLYKSQLKEVLSSLDSSESKIAGIITDRTRLTYPEISSLFAQGESKDAAFALSKGIVSEIKDPEIPKGTNILSFNLP